jgi:ATP-dependent RNA helicase DeaD
MERFRQRKIQILVATDVAARGIDVNDLTHVINYNLPDVNEVYVHRSGRTGRAHKSGASISILTQRELRKVHELEHKVSKTFEARRVPTGKEICEKQLFSLIERMKEIKVDEQAIASFLPAIEERLHGLSRQQLLVRFVAAEFNHFLSLYKDAPDLEVLSADKAFAGSKGETRGRAERQPEENFVNVRLNVGKRDRLDIKTLFGLVNAQPSLKGAEIGKVKIGDDYTIFGLDKRRQADLARSFRKVNFKGKPIEARLVIENQFSRQRRPFARESSRKPRYKKS